MKKIFILSLLLLSNYFVKAQNLTKILLTKGSYHKSIFIKDSIFCGVYYKNGITYLRTNSIENDTYTNLNSRSMFSVTGFPFCWDVYDSIAYTIDTGDNQKALSRFFRLHIENDEIEMIFNNEKRIRDSLRNTFKTEEDYKTYLYDVYLLKKTQFSNQRPVRIIKQLIRSLTGNNYLFPLKNGIICYDFIVIDPFNIEFYIRDMKQLTFWHYKYPSTYLEKEAINAWTEIVTYSADTSGSYPYLEENLWIMNLKNGWQDNPRANRVLKKWKIVEHPYSENPYMASGKKHKYESINDSAFFRGQFKIIKQSNHRFIINTMTGVIYLINIDRVVKIGQLQMHLYPLLNNQKSFIEDRDNNEIIFFAPIEWEDTDLPKPRVRVMNKKQMHRKFKYVLD